MERKTMQLVLVALLGLVLTVCGSNQTSDTNTTGSSYVTAQTTSSASGENVTIENLNVTVQLSTDNLTTAISSIPKLVL